MQRLVAELPDGDPIGLFEFLLRAVLDRPLGPSGAALPLGAGRRPRRLRRRRATIQLASSLRNVGKAEEAAALPAREALHPDDELSDAVAAFRALALSDLGLDREALRHALVALAPSAALQRVAGRYAHALVDAERDD